jgi:hypothetical protein
MTTDEPTPTQGCCDQCHRLHLLDDPIQADGDWLCSRCSGHVSLIVMPGDPSEMARLRAIEAAARQWFTAHHAHVADQRDRMSPVGEPATALRRLAELLAA